jgi:hypothetical protein
LAIEFGGDVGLPVLGDLGELFGEVDFGHRAPGRNESRGVLFGLLLKRNGRQRNFRGKVKGRRIPQYKGLI